MSFSRRHSISSFAALILLFLWAGCNENTIDPVFYGSIQGTAIYKSDGLPVMQAEVSTKPPSSITFTDSLGNFAINDVPEGEYAVVVKLEGFKNETKNIVVSKNTITAVDFQLVSNNSAPEAPSNPTPANGGVNIDRSITLKWFVKNPNKDDFTYDVTLYEAMLAEPLINLINYTDTIVKVDNLKFNTVYFWHVKVKNKAGATTNSELWKFKTLPFPDNRYLFSTQRDGNFEIYSSDESGADLVRLTTSDNDQIFPAYSNNRQLIAFTARTATGDHIYTMKHDGTEIKPITRIPMAGYHSRGSGFCWSPDNAKLLYSHYDKLYAIDRNGTGLTEIATAPQGRHFRGCDWTAIGNKIVVETVGVLPYDSEIRLIDLGNPAKDSVVVGNLPGALQSPSFSIDGKSILYTYDVSGFENQEGRQIDAQLFIYDSETRTTTSYSKEKAPGTNDLNPRFSPDGAHIIFENSANDGSGVPSVWKVDLKDTKRKMLFNNGSTPDWQ